MLKKIVFLCVLLWAGLAQAGNVEALKTFLNSTPRLKGEFNQTVYDKNGHIVQQSSGWFAISRPGKFRWVVQQPFDQLIVGDGERVWLFDPDLNQVTVRKMGNALGSSPAALLAGEGTLEQQFVLRDSGEKDGLSWVAASPKSQDAGFSKVQLGLEKGKVVAMRLFDNFGQTTYLTFGKTTMPAKQDSKLFSFTPPAGADVVGE